MLKVNNKGTRIVNLEHISHLVLVLLFLTLNMQMPTGLKQDISVSKPFHSYKSKNMTTRKLTTERN